MIFTLCKCGPGFWVLVVKWFHVLSYFFWGLESDCEEVSLFILKLLPLLWNEASVLTLLLHICKLRFFSIGWSDVCTCWWRVVRSDTKLSLIQAFSYTHQGVAFKKAAKLLRWIYWSRSVNAEFWSGRRLGVNFIWCLLRRRENGNATVSVFHLRVVWI